MKLKIAFLLILLTGWFNTKAYRLESHYGTVPGSYNYWFGSPDDMTIAKPLVIFLHGKSLCGHHLDKVKRYGTINAIERGREIDAFVIAPQNPGGAWNPEKIMNIVEWAQHHYNIDPTRIYVLGMSLGGHGTLDFAAAYPDKVAAAMAMCGGNVQKNADKLNEVPLWIVHGTADSAVGISGSDRLVKTMKEHDPETPRLHYDRVPGMNHSKPARFFYMPQTYEWLFSHRLNDNGRPIKETFAVTNEVMNNAYSGLPNGQAPEITYEAFGAPAYKASHSAHKKSSASHKKKKSSAASKKKNTKAKMSSKRTSVKRAKASSGKSAGKKKKVRVAL